MCVCVRDLSWQMDEETAPQEMTVNSKRGGGADVAVGKTWWFIYRISVLGGRHSENAKMKFDCQAISRKCSATVQAMSLNVGTKQAELPHYTSGSSFINTVYAEKQGI